MTSAGEVRTPVPPGAAALQCRQRDGRSSYRLTRPPAAVVTPAARGGGFCPPRSTRMATGDNLAEWQRRIMGLLQKVGAAESPCPACGGTKHYALPFVTAPWSFPPASDALDPEGAHLLPLACTRCGHVRF